MESWPVKNPSPAPVRAYVVEDGDRVRIDLSVDDADGTPIDKTKVDVVINGHHGPLGCGAYGHSVNGDVVEFSTGRCLAFCSKCGDRIEFDWFPGGGAALRAHQMGLALLRHEEPRVTDFEIIDEQLEHLEQDEAKIAEAREALTLARQVLRNRLDL